MAFNRIGESYIVYGGNNSNSIYLDRLTSTQGYVVKGTEVGDNSGHSVSAAGDINGDGKTDIIIGAPYSDPNGKNESGISYLIYGNNTNTDVDLSGLTAVHGFSIYGNSSDSNSGYSVSGNFDFNGDGYGDIIIGAPNTYSDSRLHAGISYVIFGKTTGFTDIFLANLTSSQGFALYGYASYSNSYDYCGYSVSGTGDVNNDGFDDIIIGAPAAAYEAGISYVIFGKAAGFTDIFLENLDSNQGFSITGASRSYSGRSVSGAGDINGDGYDDIIIGAPYADSDGRTSTGTSYIIFGKATGFTNINLASLASSQGFSIYGLSAYDYSGSSVSSAGDFNGDGYADIIIGAPAGYQGNYCGRAYVIFGKANGFTDITLSRLLVSNNQGFTIYCSSTGSYTGRSVSSAGDINGDGYDDIIIGAPGDWGGFARLFNGYSGRSYIIFGNATKFYDISLSSLKPSQGFGVYGSTENVNVGYSVSGAGDINGDGYADIIIGDPNAEWYYVDDDNDNDDQHSNSLSGGAIAGIVIGSILVFGCVCGGSSSSSSSTERFLVIKLFSSSENSMLHENSKYNWFKDHQKLLNSPEKEKLSMSDILTKHTYFPYYNYNEFYKQLLKDNDLLYLVLEKTSQLFLDNNKNYYIVFDKNTSSFYNSNDNMIVVREDLNTTYINSKSIFMHELMHMTFGDITATISCELLKTAYKTTTTSLLSYAAKLIKAEVDNNINSQKVLSDSILDLFYMSSKIQYTLGYKSKDPELEYLSELLKIDIKDEKELIDTLLPNVITEYALNPEQVYFLERMSDYINGIESGVYEEGASGCEEIAARCVEFRAAGVSDEILELCQPIEDLILQGINNSNIDV